MLKFQLATATAALTANALKVGVISDIHSNTAYNGWASEDDNCVSGSTVASEEAPLGRIKCDASPTLIDYMFQRFTEVFGTVDVIIVAGDFVAHHIAPEHKDADWSTAWPIVMANI